MSFFNCDDEFSQKRRWPQSLANASIENTSLNSEQKSYLPHPKRVSLRTIKALYTEIHTHVHILTFKHLYGYRVVLLLSISLTHEALTLFTRVQSCLLPSVTFSLYKSFKLNMVSSFSGYLKYFGTAKSQHFEILSYDIRPQWIALLQRGKNWFLWCKQIYRENMSIVLDSWGKGDWKMYN